MKPAIAVVTRNLLVGLGLRSLLAELMPGAEVLHFQRFGDFAATDPEGYVHFFVDTRTLLRHADFFRDRRQRVILLTHGQTPHFAGMHRLDIRADAEELMRAILQLQCGVHGPGHGMAAHVPSPALLTDRETEVLTLLARGLTSKEIADRLGIGTTTVVTHRRSIAGKLGIRSVAGLTLYAATMGYIDIDESGIIKN